MTDLRAEIRRRTGLDLPDHDLVELARIFGHAFGLATPGILLFRCGHCRLNHERVVKNVAAALANPATFRIDCRAGREPHEAQGELIMVVMRTQAVENLTRET